MAERGPGSRSGWTLRAPYLLVAIPTGFLLIFFVVPTMMLLSASILKSNGMMPVGGLSTGNFRMLLSESIYVGAIIRTFEIGLAVGVLVVVLAYPLAYFLVRTTSRWEEFAGGAGVGTPARQRHRPHLWLVGALQPGRGDQFLPPAAAGSSASR